MADYPGEPTILSAIQAGTTAQSVSIALTETYLSVTASSAAAVAINTTRRYLAFFNNDPAITVTFSTAATAVVNKGFVLAPGAGYVFDARAVPTNAFKVIGSGIGTVQATVVEG